MHTTVCPVCQLDMQPRTYEGQLISHCPNCDGNWLGRSQLKHVINTRTVQFDMQLARSLALTAPSRHIASKELDRLLSCPACNLDLQTRKYADDSAITVNRCDTCEGVWLDRGELEMVQMLVEAFEELLKA